MDFIPSKTLSLKLGIILNCQPFFLVTKHMNDIQFINFPEKIIWKQEKATNSYYKLFHSFRHWISKRFNLPVRNIFWKNVT